MKINRRARFKCVHCLRWRSDRNHAGGTKRQPICEECALQLERKHYSKTEGCQDAS